MDFTWIITAILCLLIIYFIFILGNKNMDYWKSQGVPQLQTCPIVGSMLDVLLGKKTFVQIINEAYKHSNGHKYVGVMLFQKPHLVICDIDLINQVLIKDFSYFQDRLEPQPNDMDLMNASMPNITGSKWRVLRHKLTPTFTSGKMKMMFKSIKDCSDEVIQYLDEKNGKDVDARNLGFRFVLNVIGNISFGITVDALNEKKEKENEFYQNSVNFFAPSIFLQLKFMLLMVAPRLKGLLGVKLVDEKVDSFFQKLTQDLIDYREKSDAKRNDFLQLMLEQKKKEQALLSSGSNQNTESLKTSYNETREETLEEPEDLELLEHLKNVKYDKNATVFTDHIIAGQTFVFISGGSETVAAIVSFALYELAVNKDVQKRLQQEIDTILEHQEFNYDSVRKMKYLEQVIYEVLRLRPPGGMLNRLCAEDYKLPGTDLVIRKGQYVYVPVQALHKDPEYFPDPETFNPDRFEDMETVPKGVFFPFGGGPRICLAMRLAMLELKIFLATLIANYDVNLSKKTQLPLQLNKKSIIQHIIGGIWVNFTPRDK